MNKAESNQQNALRSTGPRTAEGKRRSSRNSTKSGVYSVSPVLEGLESSAEWEGFRSSLLACLSPLGKLEEIFAERIALNAWRLRRIIRFETATITHELKKCWEVVERIEETSSWKTGVGDAISHFDQAAESAKFEADEVELILWQAFASSSEETERFELEVAFESYWESQRGEATWTKAQIRQPILERAKLTSAHLFEFLKKMKSDAKEAKDTYLEELAQARSKAQEKAYMTLVLSEELLDRSHRSESHLSRHLRNDLHELQRLQAIGRDVAGTIPVAVDLTLAPARGAARDTYSDE